MTRKLSELLDPLPVSPPAAPAIQPMGGESRGSSEWRSWNHDQSKENFSKLVKVMGPTIDSVTKSNPRLSPSLMRSKAKGLVMSAARSYDPASGASFSTHVNNHLKPLTIRSHGETRVIAKGRFVEEAAKDYKKVYDEFSEDHLREPTSDEMSDIMKISRGRSSELMRRTFSYEVPEGTMEGAVIPEESSAQNKKLRLWTEYVYQGLSPRDKLIMDLRLGRNGKPQLGLDDIARKAGVSTTMVHKILKRASGDILSGVESKHIVHSPDSTVTELDNSDDDLFSLSQAGK